MEESEKHINIDTKALKDKVSLVSTFEKYGIDVINKRGQNLCLCPFHKEDTPSLIIDERKGLWHCFGCEAGGDAISFVQKMEGLNFYQAALRLAEIHHVGVNLNISQNVNPKPQIKPKLNPKLISHKDILDSDISISSSPPPKEKRAKAVLDTKKSLLKFYYDTEDHFSEGSVFFLKDTFKREAGHFNNTTIPWKTYTNRIHAVEIDKSFKDYSRKNFDYFFYNLHKCEVFKGLGNIKSDDIVSTKCMFARCSSVRLIDLSQMELRNLTSMERMFMKCDSLQILNMSSVTFKDFHENGKIHTTNCEGMFYGVDTNKKLSNLIFNKESGYDGHVYPQIRKSLCWDCSSPDMREKILQKIKVPSSKKECTQINRIIKNQNDKIFDNRYTYKKKLTQFTREDNPLSPIKQTRSKRTTTSKSSAQKIKSRTATKQNSSPTRQRAVASAR